MQLVAASTVNPRPTRLFPSVSPVRSSPRHPHPTVFSSLPTGTSLLLAALFTAAVADGAAVGAVAAAVVDPVISCGRSRGSRCRSAPCGGSNALAAAVTVVSGWLAPPAAAWAHQSLDAAGS